MAEERTNRPAPEENGHIDLANYDLELLGSEVLVDGI
jgi:hypothetical protein